MKNPSKWLIMYSGGQISFYLCVKVGEVHWCLFHVRFVQAKWVALPTRWRASYLLCDICCVIQEGEITVEKCTHRGASARRERNSFCLDKTYVEQTAVQWYVEKKLWICCANYHTKSCDPVTFHHPPPHPRENNPVTKWPQSQNYLWIKIRNRSLHKISHNFNVQRDCVARSKMFLRL